MAQVIMTKNFDTNIGCETVSDTKTREANGRPLHDLGAWLHHRGTTMPCLIRSLFHQIPQNIPIVNISSNVGLNRSI